MIRRKWRILMIARGYVQNGVVVLDEGVQLPEGQEVTVVSRERSDANAPSVLDIPRVNLGSLLDKDHFAPAYKERQEALRSLIGIWKTDEPPGDDDVTRMLERERMDKYG
jgi:hypothetical protein